MATIATDVQWGSSPKIYFDFSYEKKREGSTQYYNISVSCDALTGTHYFGYPIYLEIFLDGTKKATYTLKNANPSQWSSAIAYSTGWLEVSGKTSGTTALKIRVYSGSGSTRDTTYGYSLAVDPSTSSISCTIANIGSKPIITIGSASPSFTHSISYAFGTLRGDVISRTSATSITTWKIPEEFYTQIPNAKVGEGSLTCTTYNGSTPIGTSSCKLYVTTDEAICKPKVVGGVMDINEKTIALTGNFFTLVKFCSTAYCEIGITLNKNAGSVLTKTINNIEIPATENSLTIPNVETGVFDFYAKDSREYFNTDKSVKTLIPYVKLTANITTWRDDPTGNEAKMKIEGNYFNGSFGAKNNTLTVKYRQANGSYITVTPTIKDNTYTATVSLTLAYDKTADYEVVVSDALSTVTKPVTIRKGIPVFDWGENDFNFNVPVTVNNVPIADFVIAQSPMASIVEAQGAVADFVVSQGSTDGWTWRKWNSGIAECWRYYQHTPTATGDQAFTINYPFSFVTNDYPIVTTTLGMNGTLATSALACDAVGNLPNRETKCNIFLRGITSKSYMIAVHIHALGRWR